MMFLGCVRGVLKSAFLVRFSLGGVREVLLPAYIAALCIGALEAGGRGTSPHATFYRVCPRKLYRGIGGTSSLQRGGEGGAVGCGMCVCILITMESVPAME